MKDLKNIRHKDTRSIIKDIYIYLVLLAVVVVFSVIKLDQVEMFGKGHFLSSHCLISLARQSAPIIAISCGFTLMMIAGYMDLSVGSAMSLCGVVYALVVRSGGSFFIGFIAAILVGILCGYINGILVMKLRITPVIATLVTMNLFKGIALLIVPDGISAIKSVPGASLPDWMSFYARNDVLLGLPAAFFVSIALVVIVAITQRKTVIGKYAAAIGGNSTAAELSGINVVKIVRILYIITGVLSAFAGVALASYNSLGNPLAGDGMETDCIIAVLLGGTAFTGGEGSVVKSVIGAVIIMCLTTGLLTVIEPYYQGFAKSLILVFAVTINHLLSRQRVCA
ncbi:MAG TPA: ABC transporter permease [Clostridia bacterium]|nr:ABC transporter permease [Clostridia bacterium]